MEQVLDIILERLGRIEEKQDKTLEQTTKTNGRVYRLEEDHRKMLEDVNKVKEIQSETKGRDRVIWVFICCAGVVVGYIINSFLK